MKLAQLVCYPVFMNALETKTLTEKQLEKVQVCEKQPRKNNRGN